MTDVEILQSSPTRIVAMVSYHNNVDTGSDANYTNRMEYEAIGDPDPGILLWQIRM